MQQVDDFEVEELCVEFAAGHERQEDVVAGVRFLVVYSSFLAVFFEHDLFKSLVSKCGEANLITLEEKCFQLKDKSFNWF